jgi:hypothetical protein
MGNKPLEMKSFFSQNGLNGSTEKALRDAATIILLLTRPEKPYEVFLMRRHRTADSFGIRLPHDSEYRLAAWKQQPRPGETTRIVLQDGIWKTFSV